MGISVRALYPVSPSLMPAASFVSTSTLTKRLPDVEEKALFLFFCD
jgi:hypothetical protein